MRATDCSGAMPTGRPSAMPDGLVGNPLDVRDVQPAQRLGGGRPRVRHTEPMQVCRDERVHAPTVGQASRRRQVRPVCRAGAPARAASWRPLTPSLRRMLETCTLAVLTLM